MQSLWPHPLFFCTSLCVHRLVAKPCAHILQIQAGVPRRAQPNAVLEKLYQSNTVHKHCVSPHASSMDGIIAREQHLTTVSQLHIQWRPCSVLCKCLLSGEAFFDLSVFFPVSELEGPGGTLQAAGLGWTENPEVVSRPSEPGQTQHADQVLWEHVGH